MTSTVTATKLAAESPLAIAGLAMPDHNLKMNGAPALEAAIRVDALAHSVEFGRGCTSHIHQLRIRKLSMIPSRMLATVQRDGSTASGAGSASCHGTKAMVRSGWRQSRNLCFGASSLSWEGVSSVRENHVICEHANILPAVP